TGGARRLGVPETTISAIRENHSRGIPPEDAEIVEFTRQLLSRHRVDDASAKALQTRLGNDGFIQLTGAIGYYSMLAMTVNAPPRTPKSSKSEGSGDDNGCLCGDRRGDRAVGAARGLCRRFPRRRPRLGGKRAGLPAI